MGPDSLRKNSFVLISLLQAMSFFLSFFFLLDIIPLIGFEESIFFIINHIYFFLFLCFENLVLGSNSVFLQGFRRGFIAAEVSIQLIGFTYHTLHFGWSWLVCVHVLSLTWRPQPQTHEIFS